ncbi:hypothetical protein OOT33_05755 [Sphingobium sp. DEHP117]|uniref:helix-turn-helix domain-containing protein n=1 Tax=Sphingobium sp. DEHP117 TaxID=2993436 RepID=UPI0027D5F6D7|nr:hypothetical protein [Sphingobium sp. DEHP117]MDQ4419944.1 hypothetical protein [Sphingobium sp. DEHP117]
MAVFDPDFGKQGFALHLFRLRFRRLKLSQRAFADRYGIGYAAVRNAEQGLSEPAWLRVMVEAIARDPKGMAEAARTARLPCTCSEGYSYDICRGLHD